MLTEKDLSKRQRNNSEHFQGLEGRWLQCTDGGMGLDPWDRHFLQKSKRSGWMQTQEGLWRAAHPNSGSASVSLTLEIAHIFRACSLMCK